MQGIFKQQPSTRTHQGRLTNGIGPWARGDASSAITGFAFLIALTVLVVVVAVTLIGRTSADSRTTVAGQISRLGGAAYSGGR